MCLFLIKPFGHKRILLLLFSGRENPQKYHSTVREVIHLVLVVVWNTGKSVDRDIIWCQYYCMGACTFAVRLTLVFDDIYLDWKLVTNINRNLFNSKLMHVHYTNYTHFIK
jgi:hypothetical protein